MSTVEEIEAAITKLEFDAQWDLARRLQARLWEACPERSRRGEGEEAE